MAFANEYLSVILPGFWQGGEWEFVIFASMGERFLLNGKESKKVIFLR